MSRSTGKLQCRLTPFSRTWLPGIRAADGNWVCDAVLGPELLSDDLREVFDLLMDLDPVFTLRFHEGSEILVNAVKARDGERMAITVCESAEQAA
ncbi:hypothetical protein [Kitasatospora phosalacinea]|uniref:hypothetical protein n=1 Tax=Kitasatospora phosalacinea TaxID=2065 RepID=UPI000689F3C1|nr:hypothetical protein [Kitasatospora phosalacinea]